jgi:hypothetical protein
LLADRFGRSERLVQFGFDEDAVAAAAATEPCGERLLVREGAVVHRAKLGREQLGIVAANADDDERVGIADDGGSIPLN